MEAGGGFGWGGVTGFIGFRAEQSQNHGRTNGVFMSSGRTKT